MGTGYDKAPKEVVALVGILRLIKPLLEAGVIRFDADKGIYELCR